VVHPRFLKETKAYLKQKQLGSSLPMLGILNKFGVETAVASYPHFAEGQTYCGVVLNVYRDCPDAGLGGDGGVILSSFERFNRRRASYQQVTWMANVGGVPIWSQSGKGVESISKHGVFNTHSPCVSQKGRLLVASYLAPKVLTRTLVVRSVFSFVVRMFWPRTLFDEVDEVLGDASTHLLVPETHSAVRSVFGMKQKGQEDGVIRGGIWWGGRKGDGYVAVMCTQSTWLQTGPQEDAELRLERDGGAVPMSRRVRKEGGGHSWLVVVGTTSEYPTLAAFMQMCGQTRVKEMLNGKDYRVVASLPGSHEDDAIDINLCKE